MFNRNRKRLSAEVFYSAGSQPKQNASNQNREENGSTTLRNTREKPLLAGYPGTSMPWSWMRGSCGELLAKTTNKYEKTAAEFAEFKETF